MLFYIFLIIVTLGLTTDVSRAMENNNEEKRKTNRKLYAEEINNASVNDTPSLFPSHVLINFHDSFDEDEDEDEDEESNKFDNSPNKRARKKTKIDTEQICDNLIIIADQLFLPTMVPSNNVNERDAYDGSTALHRAVLKRNHVEVKKLLETNGINIFIEDNNKQTAFELNEKISKETKKHAEIIIKEAFQNYMNRTFN